MKLFYKLFYKLFNNDEKVTAWVNSMYSLTTVTIKHVQSQAAGENLDQLGIHVLAFGTGKLQPLYMLPLVCHPEGVLFWGKKCINIILNNIYSREQTYMHVYKKHKQWKILVSKSKLFKMHNFLSCKECASESRSDLWERGERERETAYKYRNNFSY